MTLDRPPVARSAAASLASVAEAKQALRPTAAGMRAQIMANYQNAIAAGVALRTSFHDNFALPAGSIVAGYWPVGSEIDVRPLMVSLVERGYKAAMPVVINRHQPLRFRRWYPNTMMVPGRFGIPMPPENMDEVRPDVVLVPMLAFDRFGFRLGHGDGYYDRTLEVLRKTGKVLAVGIAFAGQEMATLPIDVFDQRLDWLVTEAYARPIATPGNPLPMFDQLSGSRGAE